MSRFVCTATLAALSSALAITTVQAQSTRATSTDASRTSQTASKAPDAGDLVGDAVKVADQMKKDPTLDNYIRRAKGIFIIPNMVKGSFIGGAQGGQGVLMARENGKWSNPAFFTLGSLSFGAQAGGAAGPVVFILMSDKALHDFTESNNFSLNANAGLTIVNYSAKAQADVGKGDIIVWSNMSGLEGGVNVSATDIVRNTNEDKDYYGQNLSTQQIIAGQGANAHATMLRNALPT